MYSRMLAQLALVFGLKAKLAMADKSKGAGGTGGDGGSGADDGNDDGAGSDGGDQTVKHSTYKKAVDEVKALKRQLKEYNDKMTQAENDKLAANGQKDELIAKLRGDLDKQTKTNKDLVGNFVNASLASQVREIASGLGCVDPDAIDKLVDLSDVEVDPKTFRADKSELTEMLNSLKKTKPYLFNKPGPKINTKMPTGGSKTFDVGGEQKSPQEMSKDEIRAKLNELHLERQRGLNR